MNDLVCVMKEAKRIAIVSHIRPDGDTIGSSLALMLALQKCGKDAAVFCDDAPPEKFAYLQGLVSYGNEMNGNFDLAVAVDCSDELRIGNLYDDFKRIRQTINIDHHRSNTKFAKINYVDGSASATAVIMFDVIKQLTDIDKAIADCLYTGISTDTGNFCHANTNAASFSAACYLIERGVVVSEITTALYKSSTKARTLLLADTVRRMRFFDEDRLAVMIVEKADMEKYGALSSDTEGFIDSAIGIRDVEVAACIMQHDGHNYKVSLRSKKTNVCAVAMTFGGGGHKLASGFAISGFLEDVVERVVRAVGLEMQ